MSADFVEVMNEVLNELREVLVAKNQQYGNSALDPVRIFSRADTLEQIRVRIDDKLSRIQKGGKDQEDSKLDLIGYLILERMAEKWPKENDP